MKLKFRKNKPPLKLLEKDELKHIATLRMKKAVRVVIEQETQLRQASCPIIEKPQVVVPPVLDVPICPLCKKPLGENTPETVVLNGKRILCHKTCPLEST